MTIPPLRSMTLEDVIKGLNRGDGLGQSYPAAIAAYLMHCVGDETMSFEDEWYYDPYTDVLIEPSGEVLNFFHETFNVARLMEHPDRYPSGLTVGPENQPFYHDPQLESDPRVMPVGFHYTIGGPDFLARLPKRKRDKFKTSLKTSYPVEVRENLGVFWGVLGQYRTLAKRDGYEHLVPMFEAALTNIYYPNIKVVEVVDNNRFVGGMIFVRSIRNGMRNPVWYCMVAALNGPYLYAAHQQVAETVFAEGTIFHYGVDHYFEPDMHAKFSYKRHVATHQINSPYLAIVAPAMQPPYYCQRERKWITE